MLNALRPFFARLLRPVGEALARTPITPNMITAIGTVGVAVGALWLFPTGHLFAGTLVCWGFAMFDMLDGLLARIKGTSGAWGAFLDSTLDRIGDSAVFGGLAIYLARDHQPVLACVALFCLVAGSMVSYARARAEGIGVRADVGVAERSERLTPGPDRDRPHRAGRAVRAGRRAVGARGGQHHHVRAARPGGTQGGRPGRRGAARRGRRRGRRAGRAPADR